MGRGADSSREFETPERTALDGYPPADAAEELAERDAGAAATATTDLPLAEQLRTMTKTAQQERQEKERKEKEERERKIDLDAEKLAARKIAELPEKMKEEAAAGRHAYCVFQWSDNNEVTLRAWEKVKAYAESQGLGTNVDKMEPFGSDPLFFHTVWSYYVTWYPTR